MALEPWRPRLAISDGRDGGLKVAFSELPDALFGAGHGYVLPGASLCPVASARAAGDAALARHRSAVGAVVGPAFVADCPRSALPGSTCGPGRWGSCAAARRPGCCSTTAATPSVIEVRFGYSEVEIAPDTEGEVLRAADGRPIQRDRAAEARAAGPAQPLLPKALAGGPGRRGRSTSCSTAWRP
ncbi:MAG: hypothetical protein R3F43_08305 [bacterium]